MEKIQAKATFKIHKGKVEEFKEIADKCIAKVKEKEKGNGALQYDWFFNMNQSECVVKEAYINSNAALTHLGNVGEMLGQLMTISDFNLEVYGNPSKELQKATASLNPKLYSFYKAI